MGKNSEVHPRYRETRLDRLAIDHPRIAVLLTIGAVVVSIATVTIPLEKNKIDLLNSPHQSLLRSIVADEAVYQAVIARLQAEHNSPNTDPETAKNLASVLRDLQKLHDEK